MYFKLFLEKLLHFTRSGQLLCFGSTPDIDMFRERKPGGIDGNSKWQGIQFKNTLLMSGKKRHDQINKSIQILTPHNSYYDQSEVVKM